MTHNTEWQTEAEFLATYDASRYPRPSVSVDAVVFSVARADSRDDEPTRKSTRARTLQVLLIQRRQHPFLGQWALPGGFVGPDESLDQAAARELHEETGIANIYLEQLYTYGDVDRDPRTRVLSCAYLSLADASALTVRAGDDASAARWFTIGETLLQEHKVMGERGYTQERRVRLDLTAGDAHLWVVLALTREVDGNVVRTHRRLVQSHGLGFDHGQIILYGLERLRNKIEWTPIAFSLMPPLFALSELQQVYEVILGRELLVAAFRRKIAPLVQETNESRMEGAHRPAKLYRFNPDGAEQGI